MVSRQGIGRIRAHVHRDERLWVIGFTEGGKAAENTGQWDGMAKFKAADPEKVCTRPTVYKLCVYGAGWGLGWGAYRRPSRH